MLRTKMAVKKGVFHPSRLIVCAPFPSFSHPRALSGCETAGEAPRFVARALC